MTSQENKIHRSSRIWRFFSFSKAKAIAIFLTISIPLSYFVGGRVSSSISFAVLFLLSFVGAWEAFFYGEQDYSKIGAVFFGCVGSLLFVILMLSYFLGLYENAPFSLFWIFIPFLIFLVTLDALVTRQLSKLTLRTLYLLAFIQIAIASMFMFGNSLKKPLRAEMHRPVVGRPRRRFGSLAFTPKDSDWRLP